MRSWCSAALLLAGCTETLPPFELPLDLPGAPKSAVVRAVVDGEAKVVAIDLTTGDGAGALLDGSYQGGEIELSAFTYEDSLDYVGLKPGLLSFVERGDKLWTPKARLERRATPLAPGSWTPQGAESALDQFTTNLVRSCTPFHPQTLELPPGQIRTLLPLGGDRVGLLTREGQVHTISFSRESSEVSTRVIRSNYGDMKAGTIGPDGRVWAEFQLPFGRGIQLLVETSTGGFRPIARRGSSALGTLPLYLLTPLANDPHRLYGSTAAGGLLLYEEAQDRWTKLLDPVRQEAEVYCYEKFDEAAPNYFCGGVYFEGSDLLMFDPAGRGSFRRITTDSTTISGALLNDPEGAVVTAIGRTKLGLTAVRGTTTQSSIQYYRDGRWLPWKSLIPTLRMFAIDSTGFERTVMVGIRGAMLEYFGEEPCTEVIPPVTPLAIGKLVRTDHALVMTYGDRGGFNDRIQVFIYWIDR